MSARAPFEEAAGLWLEARRPVLKEATYNLYALCLRRRLLPAFASSSSVSEEEAQAFVYSLSATLRYHTVRDTLVCLKQVVRFGIRRGLLSGGCDWRIEYPRGREARRLPVLSLPEQKKLEDHLASAPPRGKDCAIALSLWAGLRIGEACALRWEDVDLKGRSLRVEGTLQRLYDYGSGHTRLLLGSPKTASSRREVPLAPALSALLRQLRPKGYSPYVCALPGHEGPLEPRTLRVYFGLLLSRLGIRRVNYHGLRHTFATRCIEAGVDAKTVSALLGHSDVSTTLNLYVHPGIDQKRQAVLRMARRTAPRGEKPGRPGT